MPGKYFSSLHVDFAALLSRTSFTIHDPKFLLLPTPQKLKRNFMLALRLCGKPAVMALVCIQLSFLLKYGHTSL
jgi:hypothetical protein